MTKTKAPEWAVERTMELAKYGTPPVDLREAFAKYISQHETKPKTKGETVADHVWQMFEFYYPALCNTHFGHNSRRHLKEFITKEVDRAQS